MQQRVRVLTPPAKAAVASITAFMRAEATPEQQRVVIAYLLGSLCGLNDSLVDMDERKTQRMLGRRDVAIALMEISGRHQKLRFGNDA